MTIDNHHEDVVIAWLGDLGRDLPYEEQLYWRGFNIPPIGTVSETFYKRQILAQPTDSTNPEHVFKYRYQALLESCKKTLGWTILSPLSKEDDHFFTTLRVPATDEQKDFDDLVLALTKTLVDSINEKEINRYIPASECAGIKGSIDRLEKALMNLGIENHDVHIKFLRVLQDLRSCGSAHRKGSNYQKIAQKVGLNNQPLRTVFKGLLDMGIHYVDFLEELVNIGIFDRTEKVVE